VARPQDRHPLTGEPAGKGDTSKADAAAALIAGALAGRKTMGLLGGKGKGGGHADPKGKGKGKPVKPTAMGKAPKHGKTPKATGRGRNADKRDGYGGGEGRGPKGDE